MRAAVDQLSARFPEPGRPAGGALPAGELLRSEPVRLYDVTDPAPALIACGPLALTADTLSVAGAAPWSIPISELRAEAVDIRRRLNFSSRRRVFEVVMPRESVIKWELFLRHVRTRRRLAGRVAAPAVSVQNPGAMDGSGHPARPRGAQPRRPAARAPERTR